MKLLRKILICLGLVRCKYTDILLFPKNIKRIYKIIAQIEHDFCFRNMYPLEGDKRCYLSDFKVNNINGRIRLDLKYKIRPINADKYKGTQPFSYISISTAFTEGGIQYNTNLVDSISQAFVYFEEEFYKVFMHVEYNKTRDKRIPISLAGFGDILLLFNKVCNFSNADTMNCIESFDIEPIEYEYIQQYNLIVNLTSNVGSEISIKSYHQDNKLKLKVKECINKYAVDCMKLKEVISKINDMLNPKSVEVLNLRIKSKQGTLAVYSNDTEIILLNSEEEFNSFINGAIPSFTRILQKGICKIYFEDKEYTCFRGVCAASGIIEYVAISGDVRIQSTCMRYEPILLR